MESAIECPIHLDLINFSVNNLQNIVSVLKRRVPVTFFFLKLVHIIEVELTQ